MAIPDFQTLMLPLLRISAHSEVSLADATELLSREFNLTKEERNTLLPSKKQSIIKNRVGWARTYLVKAGLLQATKRAHFIITDEGKSVLNRGVTCINIKFLERYDEFKKFYYFNGEKDPSNTRGETSDENLTPEEIIHNALDKIEDALGDEILDKIMKQTPEFFENIVVKLLVAMGYGGSFEEAGKALGKSGDGGVEGVIDQDVLGLDRIYVQANQYTDGNHVGSGAIRDFFGSLDRAKASKGIFVTTSDFTNDAKETAQYLSKRLVLINGKQLVKLMIRYGIGCRLEETVYIKKLDEDFFDS